MNNLKLTTLFTALITWGVVLLLTMSHSSQVSNEKEIGNKSIISVDNDIQTVYIEYTDDIQEIKTNHLVNYHLELKSKRIAAEKLAEEKRVADLVAKREAKNKEKMEQEKKTQVASVSRGQASSTKTYIYVITAYTAGYESTGKRKGDKGYGVTTSGAIVSQGRTLACPRSIPFGTKIEIEGYGVRVCEDRGGHIVDGRLDIYIADLGEALQFGRQTLQVKIYHK